jgi:hypothetical protein
VTWMGFPSSSLMPHSRQGRDRPRHGPPGGPRLLPSPQRRALRWPRLRGKARTASQSDCSVTRSVIRGPRRCPCTDRPCPMPPSPGSLHLTHYLAPLLMPHSAPHRTAPPRTAPRQIVRLLDHCPYSPVTIYLPLTFTDCRSFAVSFLVFTQWLKLMLPT